MDPSSELRWASKQVPMVPLRCLKRYGHRQVPLVSKTEYALLNLNPKTKAVSLLKEDGDLKLDLDLPGSRTEEDLKVETDILKAFEKDLVAA